MAALAAASMTAMPARADETEDPGRLAAVQKRKFRLDHEIFAAAGLLPLDAFYKGVGPVGSYTWHMSDQWGWEVIRGQYSFPFNTSLRDQLVKDFKVKPTEIEQVQYMLTTSAHWTPLYGKLAMSNSMVVHAEMYGLIGGTIAKLTGSFKPGPQLGLGFRFFLSSAVSMRVETRYHYLFANKSTQILDVAAGLAFNLGGTD